MPDRARVTSIEAIEAFRNQLILFRDRAGRVLDEVSEHLTRTRNWLEHDRQSHWQNEIRRLQRQLEQRQQELFTAQLSALRGTPLAEQMAVQRARRVRFWQQQFEPRVQPLARQIEKLRNHLHQDMARALAYLTEVHRALIAYTEVPPDTTTPPRPVEPGPGPAPTPTSP